MRKTVVKCGARVGLVIMVMVAWAFSGAIYADQADPIAQLFEQYDARSDIGGKRALAQEIAQKIYEAEVAGHPIEEKTLHKISTLLDSTDDQIAYAGATSVVYLGEKARPIGENILKLYSRILDEHNKYLDEYNKICINGVFSPDISCKSIGYMPSDLRSRVCGALMLLKYIPSNEESWFKCVGASP